MRCCPTPRGGRPATVAAVLLLAAGSARAFSGGPPPLRAGDPGSFTCHESCHDELALNSGDVTLELLDPALVAFTEYEPGVTHELTFRVSSAEPGRRRWGFELTALVGLTAAGRVVPGPGTQSISANDRDYLSHAPALDGVPEGTWSFSWEAPPALVGTITFYACANAADGDFTNRGDFIECAIFEVGPAPGLSDADGDGLPDEHEVAIHATDPLDADTDDDGLRDDAELLAFDSSPLACDTDGDGLPDGLEAGVTEPVTDPDGPGGPLEGTDGTAACPETGTRAFVPDADPLSATQPGVADSDGDGCLDGEEDLDADGAVDADGGETDPTDPTDCAAAPPGRLSVLRLTRPLPSLDAVFRAVPCTAPSDLRLCEEAPGAHDPPRLDPTWPVILEGGGELVLIEYDADTEAPGDADLIGVIKDATVPGGLRVSLR